MSGLEEDLMEENDPLAAQYLKLEVEYIYSLQSAVPGLLLITTDSLMFTPNGGEHVDDDQLHLLLPLSQLRSIAAYADHSVMYFTKRDPQYKSKLRRHQTDLDIGRPTAPNPIKMKTEKSEPALLLGEKAEDPHSMISSMANTENPPAGQTATPTNTPTVPTTRVDDSLTVSTHSVTFSDHLLPSPVLSQKSKSTEFTLSNDCLTRPGKPAYSLRDSEQPGICILTILILQTFICIDIDSVVYLCVLAHTNGAVRKRHPYWFTIQSMEYWFRIPEQISEILFDFLLICDFCQDCVTEPIIQSPLSKNEVVGDETSTTAEPSMRGSKTTPENLCRGATCTTSSTVNKPVGFVIVPNTFDWVLPRIGSIDECSKLMLRRSQRRKRRTNSCREPVQLQTDNKAEAHSMAGLNSNSFHESEQIDSGETRGIQAAVSVPSLEEEKAALQILKQESVRWELVNASELESEQRNAKRREFIEHCLQSVTPESLPLPRSTEQSAILDPGKVRDLMRNLPPEAEGLDWHLTYSSALHGFSLRTLYHRCATLYADETTEHVSLASTSPSLAISPSGTTPFSSNQPCLLVIRTAQSETFGAMLNTHPYASSGRFYGNGSCYVFRWSPDTCKSRRRTKRRQSSCPQPLTGTESPTDPSLRADPSECNSSPSKMRPISPTCLSEPRDSLQSTSSLSDAYSSAFIEQGEEVTEDFARLFYLDESEMNEIGEEQDAQKMRFQKYTWSGKNAFFISGENESLSIGCSQGHAAIHLDDVLLHGRTDPCDTFDNEPLCATGDFLVSNLEIWSFQ
ncbi:unnamed protein product [Echinostoma caproni]|uniref:Oxidation resistance protein 1 n=1 Tax=Echinostoma caproni TaxID=27848 RepID=A0A183A8Y3_9TREM|nr:unnamed protein product [Echinostoma caproni]